jgi:hypothetical protein
MTTSSPQIALRYPLWLRAFAAALVALPIAIAWQVWVAYPAGADDTLTNLVPWLVLGCWLAVTYHVFLVELYYDDRGITHVSPLAGVVRLNWNEVVALYYVRAIEGYVLEADDGRRIWFNDWRMGIPDFAAAIQSRLPRQAQGGR